MYISEQMISDQIYHSFHDEVRLYKQHWWKCNGPCQYRRPFYGLVKRATNRAPGQTDFWWAQHKATCNGTFIKIKEPEEYTAKKKKLESAKADRGNLYLFHILVHIFLHFLIYLFQNLKKQKQTCLQGQKISEPF